MTVPVVIAGESFVYAIVKVFVVRENDVPADIVELPTEASTPGLRPCSAGGGETYESLGSNICRRQSTRKLVRVDEQPRGFILRGSRSQLWPPPT